ncbi:MAG: ABC transporter ATP-binding protein [Anaerolineaceae bacterium]|nr:MAG: ABC transporter ATP-binding protein [Anaerolineaceae bacterium]
MPQIAIQVEHLDKRFDDIHAVDNISFNVQQGEIFSLLGPNGAGKSTTISMISGLLSPDEGDASILGHSITQNGADAKACIGIVPQEIALYEDLTARENMEFWGKMYGLRGQELSDHIAIMDKGQIMASGTHDELVRLIGRQDQIDLQLSAPSEQVIAQWQEIPGVAQVAAENDLVTILADDSNIILPRLFDVANENEVRITAVDIQEPNLESVFLHLTGRALRD